LDQPNNIRNDVAGLLRTPEEAAIYLETFFRETDVDAARIAKALGDIARGKGMAQVARDAGLSRESLYKTLSGDRTPGFDTVLKVLSALGLRLRPEASSATGPQHSEDARNDGEILLRALVRTIPDLVWAKDLEGRYIFCNERFERLYGVKERDILGKTILDFRDPETAEKFLKHDRKVVEGRKPIRNEEEVIFADGHREILETVKTPILRADGRPAGVLGIGRDITNRKRLESERRANLYFFENMDKINRIFQGGGDMEQTMRDALDAVLAMFGCDRAVLVYPCDPDASSWTVRMERTTPGAPVPFPPGTSFPLTPPARKMFRALLKTDYTATFLSDRDFPGDALLKEAGIRSFLATAVHPKVGKPWVFGILQCTHEREWTEAERVLFRAISRRLADGLTSLLMHHDLKRNRELCDRVFENMPVPLFVKDAEERRYLRWNRANEEMTGISREEILGRTVHDFFSKEEADSLTALDDEAIRTNRPAEALEQRIRTRAKGERIIRTKRIPIPGESGKPACLLGISEDITDRIRAEKERLEHLRFLECLDRINRAMQNAEDIERMMQDALDAALSIFGCDRAFLVYPCDPEAPSWQVPMKRTHPRYPGLPTDGDPYPATPRIRKLFRDLLSTDGPVELRLGNGIDPDEEPWKTSEVKSVLAIALFPKTGRPWTFGLHQCSRDREWTAREKQLFQEIAWRFSDGLSTLLIHRDLKRSREFLDSVVENMPNLVFVKDAETLRYVKFNQAGEKLLGISRELLLGKTDHDLFPKGKADAYAATDRRVLEEDRMVVVPEETVTTLTGEERTLLTKKIPIRDETGKQAFLMGISEDVTERNRLEEQLRQAQKMESIGRLAGGVAHDFNNMLGIILGHSELALSGLEPSDPLRENLQEIRKAAERSADLTRQLLAFARKQIVAPRVIDLNDTLEGMLKMLRALIGEHIALSWLPGADLWPVRIDPSQVDQILANLCVNARDAVGDAGTIVIETKNATFDERYCAYNPDFLPGDFVMLSVSDNGVGMDKETAGRIFEPFFTTKEPGKGTGLGLSTVYGIVKQNDGFINVYSEPGVGTIFKVFLPRQAPGTERERQTARAIPGAKGGETILLVEDVPDILAMTNQMLERFGYRVIAVSTPEAAVRAAREHGEKIHLLISDVVMPGMNGRALADAVSSIRPGIRRLFMSGYTDDVIAHHGVLEGNDHFIQKPFSMQSFATKVRAALDDEA